MSCFLYMILQVIQDNGVQFLPGVFGYKDIVDAVASGLYELSQNGDGFFRYRIIER